jgi:hypothetical protein
MNRLDKALAEYNGVKNMLTEYEVILRKLPICSVTEYILSFISGFDDTIDNQIKKYKQAIIKPFFTNHSINLLLCI